MMMVLLNRLLARVAHRLIDLRRPKPAASALRSGITRASKTLLYTKRDSQYYH